MNSFFKIDEELTREVFLLIERFENPRIREPTTVEKAINIRRIEDGLERIMGYSEDIAEITLNLSV